MKIKEINKLCIIALQNLWQITGNNLNLDMTTQPYTEKNNSVILMVHF